jgi:hypothetical protein
MTTIKTSHLALIGLLGVLLINGENIRSVTAKTAVTGARKDTHKERVKLEKERTRNAGELSKVALDRYRSNCILVLDSATQKETYFQPGSPVIDTALGKAVRESAVICNRLGDTAIVTNGTIENIAPITADDWPAFAAVLESRGYRPSVPQVEAPPKSEPKTAPLPKAKTK